MFENKVGLEGIAKARTLKEDVENILQFHGYVNCTKAVLLYEYVRLKEGYKQELKSIINIEIEKVRSAEVFCNTIANEKINDYEIDTIKGRTLRDVYDKYRQGYNLETILSHSEIIRLFLYFFPYQNHDRTSLLDGTKYATRWRATTLKGVIADKWKYNFSESKCYAVIKEFYDFGVRGNNEKAFVRGRNDEIAILEWSFSVVDKRKEMIRRIRKMPRKKGSDDVIILLSEKTINLEKGKRLGNPLPKYQFKIVGDVKTSYLSTNTFGESECVLMDTWMNYIKITAKDFFKSWNVKKIYIRKSCKNAEYVYQQLYRIYEDNIELCN